MRPEMISLANVVAKVNSGALSTKVEFQEHLQRAFHQILVDFGPLSDYGRLAREMMKLLREALAPNVQLPIIPGERVRARVGSIPREGTIIAIKPAEGNNNYILQFHIDGAPYRREGTWIPYEAEKIVSVDPQRIMVDTSYLAAQQAQQAQQTQQVRQDQQVQQTQQAQQVQQAQQMQEARRVQQQRQNAVLMPNNVYANALSFLTFPQIQQLQQHVKGGNIVQHIDINALQALGARFINPTVEQRPSQYQSVQRQVEPLRKPPQIASIRPHENRTSVTPQKLRPSDGRLGSVKTELQLYKESAKIEDPSWVDRVPPRKRLRGCLEGVTVTDRNGTVHRRLLLEAYGIERIVGRRKNMSNERLEYLVKWKNLGLQHCTWEWDKSMLAQAPALVLRFEAAHPEHAIEVYPENSTTFAAGASIASISCDAFQLEIFLSKWRFTNKTTNISKEKAVNCSRNRDGFTGDILGLPSTLLQDTSENSSQPIALVLPDALGTFETTKAVSESPVDEKAKAKLSINSTKGPARSAEQANTNSVSKIKEYVARSQAMQESAAERWYDPVWCCWRYTSPSKDIGIKPLQK